MNGTWTRERHGVRDTSRGIIREAAAAVVNNADKLLDQMTDAEIKKLVARASGPNSDRLAKVLVMVALETVTDSLYDPSLNNVRKAVFKAKRRGR